jgi:hypothetical protein
MREMAANGLEAAGLYRTEGTPIVKGLIAFHLGAYAEAVALLLPVRFDFIADRRQPCRRDVVDWTLTEAAVRRPARRRCVPDGRMRASRPAHAALPKRRFLRPG